jgi:hypothetical protein
MRDKIPRNHLGGGSAGALSAGTAGQVSFNLYFGNTAATNPNGSELGTNNVMADPAQNIFIWQALLRRRIMRARPPGLRTTDLDGTTRGSPPSIGAYEGIQPATSVMEVARVVEEFKLESNYPNPFNPSTTIQFTLVEESKASLKVFNMLGQEVAILFEGEAQAGRMQQVKFDASGLPSGLYFAKLEAGMQQMIRKMMLLK